MEKKINYMARTFDGIHDELVAFSQKYYPELADSFNDSSIGAWLIDLISAVGDDLSYHTDYVSQEANVNTAHLRSTLLNLARENGLKVPGRKASMCEVELSCVLPLSQSSNISQPDWTYAPVLQETSIVSAGNQVFELTEPVNFAEQFNTKGYSNRRFEPSRDTNGNITGYTVTKSTIVVNGSTKVYKKVIYQNELKPFMEIVLPEQDVMEVESIIFKEASDYGKTPNIQEYHIDEEEFIAPNECLTTYRFFECDSLSDLYRFGTVSTKNGDGAIDNIYNIDSFVDYTESGETMSQRTTRYFKGKWKPLKQKFITEYTDNGYLKLIFGSGSLYDSVPSGMTTFGEYQAAKLINNDMLGVLPKAGWTMFVLYRTGGGVSSNLGIGAINQIVQMRVDWNDGASDGIKRGRVLSSMKVVNTSPCVGGKDAPSIEELRNLIKYNTSSQNRAVTVNDYKAKMMQMPCKYGSAFRSNVIEYNNKIEISFLGLNSEGKLDSALPQTYVENLTEWMTHYKQINDYIELKSGKIYNIGVSADVYIDKNYTVPSVVSSIIETIYEYFSVENRMMGQDIFIGELLKEINAIDGVLSLIGLHIYAIHGGSYSSDICPLPRLIEDVSCTTSKRYMFIVGDGATAEELDLDAIDGIMTSDYNSMYEILNMKNDIQIRVKTR